MHLVLLLFERKLARPLDMMQFTFFLIKWFSFLQVALESIKKAVQEIPDPVTKVASMSALAQIAGGDMANG